MPAAKQRHEQTQKPVPHPVLPPVNPADQPLVEDDSSPVRRIYSHNGGKLLSPMADLTPLEAFLIEQGYNGHRVRERMPLILQLLTRDNVRVVFEDEGVPTPPSPSPRQLLNELALKLPQPEKFEQRELYANRNSDEDAYHFLMRVWRAEVNEGRLCQPQLAEVDHSLYRALRTMFSGQPDKLASLIPTKSDFLRRSIGPLNPDNVREAERLAQALTRDPAAKRIDPEAVREVQRIARTARRLLSEIAA